MIRVDAIGTEIIKITMGESTYLMAHKDAVSLAGGLHSCLDAQVRLKEDNRILEEMEQENGN